MDKSFSFAAVPKGHLLCRESVTGRRDQWHILQKVGCSIRKYRSSSSKMLSWSTGTVDRCEAVVLAVDESTAYSPVFVMEPMHGASW
jgi:hypothetical protein